MRIWRCGAMLASFFFSGICFAQVPTTPIPASTPSDISVSFIFASKDQTSSHYGLGGQFTASHFVNDKIGYQVEGDYLKMDIYNLRDRSEEHTSELQSLRH